MATAGTTNSNEAAANPAEAIEYRDAPDGKAGRLVAQTGGGAMDEPQLLDQATGAPVKGAENAPQTPPMPATVSADASNVVHLPAGASIEKIQVVGTDIVLEQPDGSTITIQNAALKVPTFVIGDAEIPRETLVAVLGENGINVAAGPDGTISVVSNQSSGGDLSDATGDIGQAGPVIDLLAPTALEFPALEATERLPFALDPNDDPSITPDSKDNPGGIAVSDRQVDEAGLAVGSRAGDGSASVSGVFALTDPDGLDDIAGLTINGQTFAIGGLVGQTVVGQFGTLTITGYNPLTGVAEYTYELTSAVTSSGVNPGANIEQDRDIFDLTVTDHDGAGGSATLQIDIIDDVPVIGITDPAAPSVVEGQTLAGSWTLSAGADGVGTVDVTVGNTTQTLTAGQSVAFALAEGTLTVNADKTWSFAAASNLNNAGGVNVSFTLSAKDADNDTTSDSQTITVTDGAGPAVDPLAASASLALDDQNLADGSTPGADTSSGTIGFVAGSDAIATIVFGDTSTLTGALTWDRVSDTQIVGKAGGVTIVTLDLVRSGDSATVTATLTDNYASHPGVNADDLAALGSVKVIASDTDGDQTEGTVSVSVSDDVATAAADTDSATEDDVLVADGNVLTGSGGTDANGTDGVKDVRGADGASVTAVSSGDAAGVVGGATVGQFGTLVLGADGSYTYTLNNAHGAVQGLAAGQTVTDTFSYEITDGDGDKSSTTVTITITGTNDVPVITSRYTERYRDGDRRRCCGRECHNACTEWCGNLCRRRYAPLRCRAVR
ncbi:VCBS domain-containing protein [Ensifer canadensis]